MGRNEVTMAIKRQQEGSLSFQYSVSLLFQCCCCSVARLCWLCDPMNVSRPDFPIFHISQSLLKLLSIKSVMLSNHLILCHRLLLLLYIFLSIRVASNELALHKGGRNIGACLWHCITVWQDTTIMGNGFKGMWTVSVLFLIIACIYTITSKWKV